MIRKTVLACVVAALASAHPAVMAREEKGTSEKLPQVVREAVRKKFPSGKVVSVYDVYSTFQGVTTTLHGVKIQDGASTANLTVTPGGEIKHVAREITTRDLPRAAKTALDDKYPGATINRVAESLSGKGLKYLTYDAQLVRKEDKRGVVSVTFDSKGKVVSTSVGYEEEEIEDKKDGGE